MPRASSAFGDERDRADVRIRRFVAAGARYRIGDVPILAPEVVRVGSLEDVYLELINEDVEAQQR